MTEPAQPNRRWQFSIAALLFVMLCVAGTLTGYRLGWQEGFTSGQKKRKSEAFVIKVYDVKSIVLPADSGAAAPTPDFDSLIDTLTTTVEPETWADVGGPGSLQVMPSNLTLIVRQTAAVHEQIEDVLNQLRELQNRNATEVK